MAYNGTKCQALRRDEISPRLHLVIDIFSSCFQRRSAYYFGWMIWRNSMDYVIALEKTSTGDDICLLSYRVVNLG